MTKYAIHNSGKVGLTLKKVGDDLQNFRFNTAIAALMAFRNVLKPVPEAAGTKVWDECLETMLLMLAPIAPHITEELWQHLQPENENQNVNGMDAFHGGFYDSIHQQKWPQYDETLAAEDLVTLVVQVNGKVRDRFKMPARTNKEETERLALAAPKVQTHLEGKQISKVIVVPERLVNIVCG